MRIMGVKDGLVGSEQWVYGLGDLELSLGCWG